MDKQIFEYQNRDMQISKLQRENSATQHTKAMSEAISTVKSLQEKTDELGKDAETQLVYFSKIKTSLEKAEKELEEFESKKDELSEEDEKKVRNLANQINKLQSNLTVLKRNIEKINELFEDAKHKVIEAKKKHKVAKEKQDEISKDVEGKISKLKAEMVEMEKSIDKDLLKKYKDCKADNILPVFVYATPDLACGGCMQKIATNEVNKLKQDKKIVCEHCRRIIIYKE